MPDSDQNLRKKVDFIINENRALIEVTTSAIALIMCAMAEIEGSKNVNSASRITAAVDSPALPYVMEELKRIREKAKGIS